MTVKLFSFSNTWYFSAESCEQTDGCLGFSWVEADELHGSAWYHHKCFLKNVAIDPIVDRVGVISGVVGCPNSDGMFV